MKCPKCGKNVKKGKFCPGCGTDVNKLSNFKKQERKDKALKIKSKIALVLFLIFILLLTMVITQNLFFIKNRFKYKKIDTSEKAKERVDISDKITEKEVLDSPWDYEFKLTDENKEEDYDDDGLTNEEEVALGTHPYAEDSDSDGLSDYDEAKIHNTDPLKYSTSGDDISDFVKIKKDLDINKKYSQKDIDIKDKEINSYITLKPDNVESEVLGEFESFSRDSNIDSIGNKFTVYDFEGKIEYKLDKVDVVLLVCYNNKYTEYDDYDIKSDKMIINIEKEDNAKVFVITSKDNYEKYLKENKGGEK